MDICAISSEHGTFLNLKGRQLQKVVSRTIQSYRGKLLGKVSAENTRKLQPDPSLPTSHVANKPRLTFSLLENHSS